MEEWADSDHARLIYLIISTSAIIVLSGYRKYDADDFDVMTVVSSEIDAAGLDKNR